MHNRKLHHYYFTELNKGNIAQFSIVKHVTEINVYNFNSLSYALSSTQGFFFLYIYIATVQLFLAQYGLLKHKLVFFLGVNTKNPYCVLCCVRAVH